MNTKLITTLALATGLLVAGVSAQTASDGSAPAVAAPLAPDQIIYASQLPGVTSLTNAAAAQGLAIKQIVQSAREVTVSYQLANGQTRTISYQLLPTAGAQVAQGVPVPASAPPPVTVVPAPVGVPTVTVVPAPTVIYTPAVESYYYDPYYSGYWYPPVSVSLGLGWGWGHGYGHGWGGHGHRH